VSARRGIGMMSGGGKMPNMGTRMMADSADDVPVSTEEGVGGKGFTQETQRPS